MMTCLHQGTRPREGVLFESHEGLIFDVRGNVHPPGKVIGFIKYVPDPSGDRKRDETTFRKVDSIADQFRIAKERTPAYLLHDPILDEDLSEVPINRVTRWYDPVVKLGELRSRSELGALEGRCVELAELLRRESGVPLAKLGVTGSVLVDLQTEKSDIDLVAYGSRNCVSIHRALNRLLGKDRVEPRSLQDLRELYERSGKSSFIPFDIFVELERRKIFKGKFRGSRFFIRFVKDWDEIHGDYGSIRYQSLGPIKVEATIMDSSQGISMPHLYKIGDVLILEGPAGGSPDEMVCHVSTPLRTQERIVAHGKLEQVLTEAESYRRVVIGGKPWHYISLARSKGYQVFPKEKVGNP